MVTKGTSSGRRRRAPKPLDQRALNDLALSYVARFATSSGKLEAYLRRKIRERGTQLGAQSEEDLDEGGGQNEGARLDVSAVVARMVELRYVDDEAYARSKAGGLLRRGYGGRRVEQALRADGIEDQLRSDVAPKEKEARLAAFALAEKRRFGPFGSEPVDRAKQEKQIAAMIRAGHGFDSARALISAQTIEQAEEWLAQADDYD